MSKQNDIIEENYKRIIFEIENAVSKYRTSEEAQRVTLVAAVKTVSLDRINKAIACGVKVLGENHMQEYMENKSGYAAPEEVHFIGHLQTNKVKYVDDGIKMVQSLDSLRLADALNKRAASLKRGYIDVLVQVNIGKEVGKSGVFPEDLDFFLCELTKYERIHVQGLMTIPPKENNENFFCKMQKLFVDNQSKKLHNNSMCILSMGMSNDFPTAIRHGANMVRIGTGLFGSRLY